MPQCCDLVGPGEVDTTTMLLMNKGAMCQGHTPPEWLSQDAAQGVYLPRAHALSTTSHSASEGEPRNQLKTTYSPKQRHTHHTGRAKGTGRQRGKRLHRERERAFELAWKEQVLPSKVGNLKM